MGHSSIQITADTYVHLISGRNVGFIDRLDTLATSQQNATGAQPAAQDEEQKESQNNPEVVEELEQFVSGLKACCRRLRAVSRCCK